MYKTDVKTRLWSTSEITDEESRLLNTARVVEITDYLQQPFFQNFKNRMKLFTLITHIGDQLIEHTISKSTEVDIMNFVRSLDITTIVPSKHVKYDCVIHLRQSIKNDQYKGRYDRMNKLLTSMAERLGYKTPLVKFYQDLSGYFSYQEVFKYLLNPKIKAIFVAEISRLSRNVEAYLEMVNYAFDHHKRIYLNDVDITRGSGYISGLIQAIFAEMELLSKQTQFSYYMLEVALFLTEKITLSEIKNEKAKKLVRLARFDDFEPFIQKMMDKAIGVVNSPKSKSELKDVAKAVIEALA